MNISDLIIMIIGELMLILTFLYSYKLMSGEKINFTKIKLLLLIPVEICLLLNNLYTIPSLRVIISYLITVLESIIYFKGKLKDNIFYSTMYMLVGIFIEVMMSIIFLSKIKNIELLNAQMTFKMIISILFSIITLLVFKSKKVKIIINRIKEILSKYTNFYTLIYIMYILFIICIYNFNVNFTTSNFIIYVTLSFILMFINFRIIINEKYNNIVLEDRNKNLKDSHKAYSETIDEYKTLKHNLKNDLYFVKTSLPKEHQEGINEIILKYNKKLDWINKIDEVPEGLQGIIYLKINEASKRKVKIFINTKQKIKTNNKDLMNLCSVVGILIDNAIEASSKTKKKIVEINIHKNDKGVLIQILNPYKNYIDLNKIGKRNYSTKEYKSGLGLDYIKKLKMPRVKVDYKIVNDIFITNIKYYQK